MIEFYKASVVGIKNLFHSTSITLALFFTSVGIAYSATQIYYVSPEGNSPWSECQDIAFPCSVDTAVANATAGDTVLFLEGRYETTESTTYRPRYHARWKVTNSGTAENPITFMAYPYATVVINGTVGPMEDDQIRVFSTTGDHIIFDGFIIQANNGEKMGSIIIGYDSYDWNRTTDGCIIRNCVFNGGTSIVTSTDNREGLRIEWTTNTLVQNNRFYDYKNTDNNHNTSAIKMYHNKNTIIENSEIYNCSTGIYDKSDGQGSIYRYNYIHHCFEGLLITGFGNSIDPAYSSHPDGQIYHNVFSNQTRINIFGITQQGSHSRNQTVYNNTFFSGSSRGVSVQFGGGDNKKFYNNIIYGLPTDNDFRQLRWQSWGTTIAEVAECDHNQFGNLPSSFGVKIRYTSYLSLSDWQNSGALADGANPGEGSLASDPLFINISGQMNTLDDFRLTENSPCKGTGRDGVDMGAFIDRVGIGGNDTVIRMPAGLRIFQ